MQLRRFPIRVSAFPFVQDRDVGPRTHLHDSFVLVAEDRFEGTHELVARLERHAFAEPRSQLLGGWSPIGFAGLRAIVRASVGGDSLLPGHLPIQCSFQDVFIDGQDQRLWSSGIIDGQFLGDAPIAPLRRRDLDVRLLVVFERLPDGQARRRLLDEATHAGEEQSQLEAARNLGPKRYRQPVVLFFQEILLVFSFRQFEPEGVFVHVDGNRLAQPAERTAFNGPEHSLHEISGLSHDGRIDIHCQSPVQQCSGVPVTGVGLDGGTGTDLHEFSVVAACDQWHDGHVRSQTLLSDREASGNGVEELAPVALVAVSPASIRFGFGLCHFGELQFRNRCLEIE